MTDITTKPPLDQRQKSMVLHILSGRGSLAKAARAARCAVSDIIAHRRLDRAFAAALDESREVAFDSMEDEINRRAFDGVEKAVRHQGFVVGYDREYSDTLAVFMMRAARPHRYAHHSLGPEGAQKPDIDGSDAVAWIGAQLDKIAKSTEALAGLELPKPDENDYPTGEHPMQIALRSRDKPKRLNGSGPHEGE